MEISLGELCDRLTIDVRKKRILPESVTDKEINTLRDAILDIVRKSGLPLETFLQDLVELSDANYGIWELEFKLRQGKDEELDLAIIGSRALKIRDLNSIRVKIKNKMNEYSGTGFKDIKVAHISGEGTKNDSI